MAKGKPIEVAIIGGGCASMATAFELTRPELKGQYHVTIYQMGWRLGGKGASGRGPADRIEEHGLHIWQGFYENAFRLMRECYKELGRDPRTCRFADWRDAFFPDPHVGMADESRKGGWLTWTAFFPPGEGLPGDPLTTHNPFTMSSYLAHTVALLRSLLLGVQTRLGPDSREGQESQKATGTTESGNVNGESSSEALMESMMRLVKYGYLSTMAGLIEALAILEVAMKSLPTYPDNMLLTFIENIASNVRGRFEEVVTDDDELRYKWEIIDLVVAILVGFVRSGLLYDPRGLDAINEYDCREWLRENGASERSLNSAFVRGLYDLALAYEGGDPTRPGLAAGQALRGSLRMFFTYRGSMFWKMRAGMGDVVFAPFYEVLKKRGVTFKFFHRLENVHLVDPENLSPGETPYVESLEFDVQAKIRGGTEYQPLVEVKGIPSWPSQPDYRQLINGQRMRREEWDFESHWDRRKIGSRTLKVSQDFDFVVLGVSVGAVPYVCKDILSRDQRWRDMVENVKTVSTQAFQIWMREDMSQLGWTEPPVTVSAFVKPFDTWSDMGHCIPEESWESPPRSLAYFCNVLEDPPLPPDRSAENYPSERDKEVRQNAIDFLNNQVHHLWAKAVKGVGEFRWDLLVDPKEKPSSKLPRKPTQERFNSQYWRANINPTDRYVLALPGTLKYRISPLDNTYDNLTICGDWTDCGFNEGCVEAAVMSGRLAAHAIGQSPSLEDIIGYDHP
ncbi:MAG: NAD(P)-binding protein [Nitrospirota bacterium]|nr:MAG: NAD(P)-binding protein [Nitrospirota bacterium]